MQPSPRIQTPRNALSARLIAAAATIALLYFGRGFFITMTIAVMIAFILDPSVAMLTRFRVPRPLASLLVCVLALGSLLLVGIGISQQLSGLTEELPVYGQRINELVDTVTARVDQIEHDAYQIVVPKRLQDTPPLPEPPQKRNRKSAAPTPSAPAPIPEVRLHRDSPPLFEYAYHYLTSIYDTLVLASFVPFLVYFMLSWRDHIHRRFVLLFHTADQMVAGRSWSVIADVARAYVVGNFLLGVLLSVISAGVFHLLRLPYWLVVGPLSGFLSLVPYVGLPLAMGPPLAAAMILYRGPMPYVVIVVTVAFLHLLALNVMYPKLVGSRVHLNPLVVTVALMFWGTLWGGIGLLLAIPITAGIKAVCDNVPSLQPYGKLLGDDEGERLDADSPATVGGRRRKPARARAEQAS